MKTLSIVSKTGSLLVVSLLIVIQNACNIKKQSSATSSVPAEVPELFERTGELASASEWQNTKVKVDELKKRIRENPEDVRSRLQVAVIYLSEARITGEHPYYYPAVLKILDGVLALDPQNFEANTYKASVKMSQHQFAEARALAEKARLINPANAHVYGVLVDANVELGDYEQAVKMSDRMQELKPSLESYSRVSYLREIYGDLTGSIEAMKFAVQAGVPGSEPFCWSKSMLGHLYETTGQLREAEQQYREILHIRPSYAFAQCGIARVYKAQKKYDLALRELEEAAKIMPEFSFHEDMAEIYALQGDEKKAKQKYMEVIQMLGEDASSGHMVDLELCKLHTKTGQLDSALVYGLKEFEKRPKNIDVNHALALIYYNRKNNTKALEHLEVALRTGSKDPELLRVAGAIDMDIDKKVLARAQKTSPILAL
jgi:tetratricopeptide (TPR) repeat protein